MRLVILLTLAFAAFAPTVAAAQPVAAAAAAQPTVRASVVKRNPHGDRIESKDRGMALLFWGFAAATIGGALFVVTRRNLIAAVMGMVGSFLGISAVYMMLYATFLSVIQMLVYAGAIMVLFVFVIMILNRPEDEPVPPSGRVGQVLGALAITYLVGRLILLLINVTPQSTPLSGAVEVCKPRKLGDVCLIPRNDDSPIVGTCVATADPGDGERSFC